MNRSNDKAFTLRSATKNHTSEHFSQNISMGENVLISANVRTLNYTLSATLQIIIQKADRIATVGTVRSEQNFIFKLC